MRPDERGGPAAGRAHREGRREAPGDAGRSGEGCGRARGRRQAQGPGGPGQRVRVRPTNDSTKEAGCACVPGNGFGCCACGLRLADRCAGAAFYRVTLKERTFLSSSRALGSRSKWSRTGCRMRLMAAATAGLRSEGCTLHSLRATTPEKSVRSCPLIPIQVVRKPDPPASHL